MDNKSNISELNKPLSFAKTQDISADQTKKTKTASTTDQAKASTSGGRKASKASSAIFAEASKKLPSPSPKPGWSTKNPVVVIKSQAEFTKAAQTMLAQIEKNNPNDTTLKQLNELRSETPMAKNTTAMLELSNGGNEALKKLQSLKSHDEYMNQPVDDKSLTHKFNLPITTLSAANLVDYLAEDDATAKDEEDEGLVYNIDGNPVGLALCHKFGGDDGYYIGTLVADPWSRGVGTTLIEAAVNRSEEHGLHGKVSLIPLNDEVKKQYESLGFELIDNDIQLYLVPEASDKWLKNDDGQYYYAYKPDDQKGSDNAKPIYFTSLESLKP